MANGSIYGLSYGVGCLHEMPEQGGNIMLSFCLRNNIGFLKDTVSLES